MPVTKVNFCNSNRVRQFAPLFFQKLSFLPDFLICFRGGRQKISKEFTNNGANVSQESLYVSTLIILHVQPVCQSQNLDSLSMPKKDMYQKMTKSPLLRKNQVRIQIHFSPTVSLKHCTDCLPYCRKAPSSVQVTQKSYQLEFHRTRYNIQVKLLILLN